MRSYQGQYAGVVTRLVALVIDLALISLTTFVVTWVYSSVVQFVGIPITNCAVYSDVLRLAICNVANGVLILTGVMFLPLYLVFFWYFGGQTIGKGVMGIRIVRLDARPMKMGTVLRRLIGYAVCFATLGLGFAWALVDDRRRGLHDKIAGTCVVYAWEAEADPAALKNWFKTMRDSR